MLLLKLEHLNSIINQLITIIQSINHPDELIVGEWNAKQVLGHVVFWHESFARNVHALAEGSQPVVLKGKLSELNQRSIAETADSSQENLIERMQNAQAMVATKIGELGTILIPYRQGSRSYSPLEHLQITHDHILAHVKELEKAIQKTRLNRD